MATRGDRVVQAGRLVWGGLLAGAPGAVLTTLNGRPPLRSQLLLLRVLGVRHLLQGGLELARPTRTVLRYGAAVDLLHATTCVGAVVFLPDWRRPALVDGTGAVSFAATALARARRRPDAV